MEKYVFNIFENIAISRISLKFLVLSVIEWSKEKMRVIVVRGVIASYPAINCQPNCWNRM